MPTDSKKIETTLADLAVTQVLEKTPQLADHYTGFEVIQGTQNEEGTRAAGLLGFNVGSEEILIPVLFLNGNVKGTEVLYLRNADVFTSNTKPWVEFLTSKNSETMGRGARPKMTVNQPSAQDLSVFRRDPSSLGKTAAVLFGEMPEFMDGAANTFWGKVASCPYPESEDGDFKDQMKRLGKRAYLDFMSVLDKNPELLSKVAHLYDLDKELFIHDWPEEKQDTPSDDEISDVFSKFAGLIIVTSGALDSGLNKKVASSIGIDNDVLEQCFTKGVAFIDKRAADETSLVVEESSMTRLSSPQESGFYNILTKNGTMEKVFIAHQSFFVGDSNKRARGSFIVDPESGVFISRSSNHDQILAMPKATLGSEDWEKSFSEMPKISSVGVGKTYMMVTKNMDTSCPFVVENKQKEGERLAISCRVPYAARGLFERDSFPGVPVLSGECGYGSIDSVIPLRVIKGAEYASVSTIGGITCIPEDVRVIELYEMSSDLGWEHIPYSIKEKKNGKAEFERKRKVYFRIYPGNTSTVSSLEMSGSRVKDLSVSKTASDYRVTVNNETVFSGQKNAALEYLAVDLGMRVSDAEDALDFEKRAGIPARLKVLQRNEFEKVAGDPEGIVPLYSALGAGAGGLVGGGIGSVVSGLGGGYIGNRIAESLNEPGDDSEAARRNKIRSILGTVLGGVGGLTLVSPVVTPITAGVGSAVGAGVGGLAGLGLSKVARGPSLNASGLLFSGMSTPEPDVEVGVNRSGVREVGPGSVVEQVPLGNVDDGSNDWRNLDEANWSKIKPSDIEFLMRVADSESKPVFESSVINLLLRSSRTQTQIGEWLPDLVNGLDAKCRLLLSFYWHNAEFAEKYGKDDLAEFEDILLNCIDQEGKLVLFLKQSSSESMYGIADALS